MEENNQNALDKVGPQTNLENSGQSQVNIQTPATGQQTPEVNQPQPQKEAENVVNPNPSVLPKIKSPLNTILYMGIFLLAISILAVVLSLLIK